MKSFSARAKDAVARADDFDKLKSCCRRAELTGFALGCGTPVLVGGEGVCFCMRTEHAASARRAVQIIRAEFAEQPVLRIVRAARLGGRTAFEVRLTAECTRKVLHGCDISFSEMTIPKHCLLKKCCRASFLRGLFLACGTIAAPESGYQMEFLLAGGRTAESVMRFLRAFCGIRAGVAERKGADIVYIRDSESLIRLLSMIGANAAILEIENVRIMKDARNRANRAANCDAANIAKVVGTADRNLRSIEKIRHAGAAGRAARNRRAARRACGGDPGGAGRDARSAVGKVGRFSPAAPAGRFCRVSRRKGDRGKPWFVG